ncbi:DUF4234 domain-containing protein [Clostridiaceae bacterium]|nr:DUF4234 domain-containing protein [Clostridiaceae bacterium]RKI18463.1 DUF4234 domain-containing protein [bacterium 1XD21-70]
MVEKDCFRIPEDSGCIKGVLACAAVLFLTQFFGLQVIMGDGSPEWNFYWRFPLHFYGNIVLLQAEFNDLALPVLLAILGIAFGKKAPELLAMPLVFAMVSRLIWIFVGLLENLLYVPGWVSGNLLRLASIALLLLVFTMTLSGRLKQKAWLLLVAFGYPALFAGHRLFKFLSVAALGTRVPFSLSTVAGVAALYLAYGIMGLALSDDPGRPYVWVGERIPCQKAPRRWYTISELLKPKSITINTLLSVATLGIYRWFWMYSVMKRVRYLAEENASCGAEMLCYLFVPFYGYYWFYTRGKRLADGAEKYGIALPRRQGIYLVILLLASDVLALALMQSDLNEFARIRRGIPKDEAVME